MKLYDQIQVKRKYFELAEYVARYNRLGIEPSETLNLRIQNLIRLTQSISTRKN